jgi:hypothetical protein
MKKHDFFLKNLTSGLRKPLQKKYNLNSSMQFHFLFRTVKTAGPHLISIKIYSKNTHLSSFLKWIIRVRINSNLISSTEGRIIHWVWIHIRSFVTERKNIPVSDTGRVGSRKWYLTSGRVGSGHGKLGSGQVGSRQARVGSGRVTASSGRLGSGRVRSIKNFQPRVGSGRVKLRLARVGLGHENSDPCRTLEYTCCDQIPNMPGQN